MWARGIQPKAAVCLQGNGVDRKVKSGALLLLVVIAAAVTVFSTLGRPLWPSGLGPESFVFQW
jgi:hypothetical protein